MSVRFSTDIVVVLARQKTSLSWIILLYDWPSPRKVEVQMIFNFLMQMIYRVCEVVYKDSPFRFDSTKYGHH